VGRIIKRPGAVAGAYVFAMRLTVAKSYFFLVVVFFAADLVVFFETDFLAAAMGPPFVGKSHMSQQEDYIIQNTIPSGKTDSRKNFYTTGA
jgi:hypothetical protein